LNEAFSLADNKKELVERCMKAYMLFIGHLPVMLVWVGEGGDSLRFTWDQAILFAHGGPGKGCSIEALKDLNLPWQPLDGHWELDLDEMALSVIWSDMLPKVRANRGTPASQSLPQLSRCVYDDMDAFSGSLSSLFAIQ
jgi:hypothetical protein